MTSFLVVFLVFGRFRHTLVAWSLYAFVLNDRSALRDILLYLGLLATFRRMCAVDAGLYFCVNLAGDHHLGVLLALLLWLFSARRLGWHLVAEPVVARLLKESFVRAMVLARALGSPSRPDLRASGTRPSVLRLDSALPGMPALSLVVRALPSDLVGPKTLPLRLAPFRPLGVASVHVAVPPSSLSASPRGACPRLPLVAAVARVASGPLLPGLLFRLASRAVALPSAGRAPPLPLPLPGLPPLASSSVAVPRGRCMLPLRASLLFLASVASSFIHLHWSLGVLLPL